MNKEHDKLIQSILDIEKKINQEKNLNEDELLEMFLATIIKRVNQNE